MTSQFSVHCLITWPRVAVEQHFSRVAVEECFSLRGINILSDFPRLGVDTSSARYEALCLQRFSSEYRASSSLQGSIMALSSIW